ncbi:MAG TPA: serine/threonine-protein kinase, partial [Polyangia bacterium]
MPERLPQKFGAYVLLRPLGAGGMGEVYLAMSGHRELETLCVVKRLRPALLSQPEHVRRFRHEADLARRLVHGNLAHTHNIGEVDGEVFLVQELVEGHDVSALLEVMAARRRVLPVPVAAYIASEVARGLSYAHAFENLDLVHRDINPPNVCLNYSGEVKLLDFGIASSNLHGERGSDHQAVGKLWHLAPEQLQPGAKIDRRTDVYALGVVLWELLTQRQVGTSRENGREVRLP